jgi:predicted O-linked N-acetylglucosamine transferase (SPINDLY family)
MIMQSAGLPEFIAHSADEYVNIARRYAGDLPSLALVRAGLRDRFLAAPFADAARVARDLENIYQGLWRDWCHAAAPD